MVSDFEFSFQRLIMLNDLLYWISYFIDKVTKLGWGETELDSQQAELHVNVAAAAFIKYVSLKAVCCM